MTTQPPDLKKLREVAERATPQDFDSAQIVSKGGWIECPGCGGEGWVELTADYCNYDDEAIGVHFYGVGQAHVNAEEFYRNFNPQTILALLDELAALRKENEGLRALAEKVIDDYSYYERYGATCTFEGAPMIYASVLEELMEAARAAIGDSHE